MKVRRQRNQRFLSMRPLVAFVSVIVFATSGAGRADDDEPYVSPFADDDEPYRSPFDNEDEGDEQSDESATDVDDVDDASRAAAAVFVEDVTFENREYFREETARSFLTHAVPGKLDEEILARDRSVLEGRYKDRGYLEATVALRIDQGTAPQGRKVVYVVTAGKRATIDKVSIHGNELVSDETLVVDMFTKSRAFDGMIGDVVVIFTRAGFYHKPFLDQDTQVLLKNFYRQGHLEARVDGVRTAARSDRDAIEVIFDVDEGPLYELTALIVDGDLPPDFDAARARAAFSIKDGAPADIITAQAEGEKFLDEWRRRGHPFAKVSQSFETGDAPSGDETRKGITLRLTIERGARALVRKVNIVGNEGLIYGTMDHVIRRDLKIREGEAYDLDLVEDSKNELRRTGFFSAIESTTHPTDDPGLVDVEIKVTEQPTFLLSLAPAFIASEGPLLIGIIGDRNLVGTGLSTLLVGTLSFQRQVFDYSLVEPRLLGTRVQVAGELHRRLINYPDFILASHAGGGVRVSFPAFFDVFLSSGFTLEYGGVQNYKDTPDIDYKQLQRASLFPFDVFRNVAEISGTFDKRDHPLQPRDGVFASGTLSYAGPYTLSSVAFTKAEGNLRLFYTPFWNVTLKSNTRLGGVFNPHGDVVPVTDRFFIGGFGSVRGYFPRSITPTMDALTIDGEVTKVRVGGTRMFVQNLEVEAPLWPDTPFRGFLFLDAGNTWKETDPLVSINGIELERGAILPLGLFWSVGFGVLIQTPILPFRFEWSLPLTRRDSDTRAIDFFVGVGSAF